jgi:hypothetical protein
MRLSMEEVQKQHESTKKLYEQGLTVAPVDVKRVLDLYDTIEALQQENGRLNAALDKAVDMIGESRCPTDYCLRKCSDYETCLHCWKDWFLGGKNDV